MKEQTRTVGTGYVSPSVQVIELRLKNNLLIEGSAGDIEGGTEVIWEIS